LRRFPLGELIDASFKIVQLNWRTMVITVAWLVVPLAFVQIYLQRGYYHSIGEIFRLQPGQRLSDVTSRALVHPPLLSYGVSMIQGFVVAPLLSAFLVRTVMGAHLGETVGSGVALRRAVRIVKPVLWVVLLTFFVLFAIAVVAIAPIAATSGRSALLGLTVAWAVGMFVLLTFTSVRLLLSVQTVVVEHRRGIAALRRSWDLSRGSGWKLYGNTLVMSLLVGVIAGLLATVPTLLLIFGDERWWWVAALGTGIAAAITTPLVTTQQSLLYLHCRVVKDELTVEALERGLVDASSPPVGPTQFPTPPGG
jgi:hypothetical protein